MIPLSQLLEIHDGTEAIVKCPKCENTYVHIIRVRVNQNGMVTTVDGNKYTLDPNGPKTGRGTRVSIECHCESGCLFALEFQFHKGNLYLETTDQGECGENWPNTLWRD
jgi:hypothetical protein